MKNTLYFIILTLLISCANPASTNKTKDIKTIEQTEFTNSTIKEYAFLDCMYQDTYFPTFLVDKCKNILLQLCYEIENTPPNNLEELYKLTQSSTIEINNLQEEFYNNNSEIETVARECLALDFEFIAKTYGYEADIEELIATREW